MCLRIHRTKETRRWSNRYETTLECCCVQYRKDVALFLVLTRHTFGGIDCRTRIYFLKIKIFRVSFSRVVLNFFPREKCRFPDPVGGQTILQNVRSACSRDLRTFRASRAINKWEEKIFIASKRNDRYSGLWGKSSKAKKSLAREKRPWNVHLRAAINTSAKGFEGEKWEKQRYCATFRMIDPLGESVYSKGR